MYILPGLKSLIFSLSYTTSKGTFALMDSHVKTIKLTILLVTVVLKLLNFYKKAFDI